MEGSETGVPARGEIWELVRDDVCEMGLVVEVLPESLRIWPVTDMTGESLLVRPGIGVTVNPVLAQRRVKQMLSEADCRMLDLHHRRTEALTIRWCADRLTVEVADDVWNRSWGDLLDRMKFLAK